MSYPVFHIIHIFSVLLLVGLTFGAFAAPDPDRRKKTLMFTGILSMVVLITGLGLMGILHVDKHGWIGIKILSWLVLSALAGLSFRFKDKIDLLQKVAIIVIAIAVIVVSTKPF